MTEWLHFGLGEVIQSLTGLGVAAVIKYVKGTNQRLDTLNGSVAKLKDWSVKHERKDTARFNRLMKGMK